MSKVSISRAWEESTKVLGHDGRLLVPVALALFVLPGLVIDLAVPDAAPGKLPPAGLWMPLVALALFVSLVGQLAVIRLAMGPHLTVAEAIRHGARRLPVYLGAVLIWMLPFVFAGAALSSQIAATPASPRPAATLGMLVVVIFMLFLAVRLILTSAVASAESANPLLVLRRSWFLTKGNWWRLFGFFVMFMIGAVSLFWAIEAVFGVLANMILSANDRYSLGWLLVRIVSQLVSAMISVVFFVMLARIYLQLAGRGQASVPSSGI